MMMIDMPGEVRKMFHFGVAGLSMRTVVIVRLV